MTELNDASAHVPADAPAYATVMLPVSDAAPRLGLSPIALRSRIRRGSVAARRGNSGQLLVEVPAHVPAHAEPGAGEAAGARPDAPLDELQAETDALRRELADAAAKATRAEAERDIATATAAAKVEAAERIIARLTIMLDDARRPWWRKLLG